MNVYNFAMAHLRTLAGIDSATPQQINPGGTSYVLVAYHGDIAQLAAALQRARLDGRDAGGTVVKIQSASRQAAGASAAVRRRPCRSRPAAARAAPTNLRAQQP